MFLKHLWARRPPPGRAASALPHPHVDARLLAGVAFSALALACAYASRHDEIVRAQAATDLSCPAADFVVVDHPNMYNTYKVKGCDRTEVYQVRCNLFGMCRTADSKKLAQEEARHRAYLQHRREMDEQKRRRGY